MQKHEKDKVGFREYFAIIFLTLGSKATDMSTVIVYGDGLNAAWLIVLGSFLLIIPSLLLLNNVLKKYQTKDLLEVTQLTLGKPFAFIIAFLFLSFAIINTASDTRSYMAQLFSINFPNTPLFILFLCFFAVCTYSAKKGWESIASIAWIVFPYIVLSSGLLLFLILKDEAIFHRMFPLFGPGKWEIAKASFKYTALFSEPFILAIMYPFVKNHQTYTRSLYSSLLLCVSFLVLMYLSYIWIFDYRSIAKITYPYNEMIQLTSLGKALYNIETFFITFWLIGIFIKFTIYIYVICKIFGFLFHIEEFEHTIIPIAFLIFVIAMLPANNEYNMLVLRSYSAGFYKYLLLFLPPLLWIVLKMKESWSS